MNFLYYIKGKAENSFESRLFCLKFLILNFEF